MCLILAEEGFFGVSMYWSHFGWEDYRAMLMETGFRFITTTVIGHRHRVEKHAPTESHPILFAQVVRMRLSIRGGGCAQACVQPTRLRRATTSGCTHVVRCFFAE